MVPLISIFKWFFLFRVSENDFPRLPSIPYFWPQYFTVESLMNVLHLIMYAHGVTTYFSNKRTLFHSQISLINVSLHLYRFWYIFCHLRRGLLHYFSGYKRQVYIDERFLWHFLLDIYYDLMIYNIVYTRFI